ncbi:unnamed protein product [Lampetra fluviatilis]
MRARRVAPGMRLWEILSRQQCTPLRTVAFSRLHSNGGIEGFHFSFPRGCPLCHQSRDMEFTITMIIIIVVVTIILSHTNGRSALTHHIRVQPSLEKAFGKTQTAGTGQFLPLPPPPLPLLHLGFLFACRERRSLHRSLATPRAIAMSEHTAPVRVAFRRRGFISVR